MKPLVQVELKKKLAVLGYPYTDRKTDSSITICPGACIKNIERVIILIMWYIFLVCINMINIDKTSLFYENQIHKMVFAY
jgi:hypothetical protein